MAERSLPYETYLSPFTWRYGTEEMRHLWSQSHKRRLWRRVWVALARAQHEAGLVTAAQLADLEAHEVEVDIARALEIEVTGLPCMAGRGHAVCRPTQDLPPLGDALGIGAHCPDEASLGESRLFGSRKRT